MSSPKKLSSKVQNSTQKRRNRRKKIQHCNTQNETQSVNIKGESLPKEQITQNKVTAEEAIYYDPSNCSDCCIVNSDIETIMNDPVESRDKVKAAREAKKLAKQQAKMKKDTTLDTKTADVKEESSSTRIAEMEQVKENITNQEVKEVKSSDEVDKATVPIKTVGQVPQDKEKIKAERAAKKAAKQTKKKGEASGDVRTAPSTSTVAPQANPEMTVRDVIQTLRDIKVVAQDVKGITAQVQALDLDKKKHDQKTTIASKKPVHDATTVSKAKEAVGVSEVTKKASADEVPKSEEGGKSKAELKAERRAKQEAQRAAKEAAQAKAPAAKPKDQIAPPTKDVSKIVATKDKSPKLKSASKQSTKQQGHKVSWFRHLYNEDDKDKLNKLPINSNLHPAIIKLGVQLATRVVTGSSARCVALLDALKKMVRDYSLPAKTEFGRGLEAHLATSLEFLWSMRQPTASQTNAVKFFRHHLTQLPNNVDEFDAKKTLQEEIDRYIREQIDMAGEAISITVRNKISNGDKILTYGCSSLIERILVEAHEAGVEFRAVVCGGGVAARGAREMARRLTARGVPTLCVDFTALGFVMRSINKVLLGASSLLANGCVLAAAGTAAAALTARAFNKPVLVACETHKFSERVQTDAFVYNEIGDPDDLIDKSDENSPLKDWRSNPNLTPLNLTYDVTPPHLITAVVTELAILPCTSAPVVLRFKLSEYSI